MLSRDAARRRAGRRGVGNRASGLIAIWQIQDKIVLDAEAETAIEFKREFAGGQDPLMWTAMNMIIRLSSFMLLYIGVQVLCNPVNALLASAASRRQLIENQSLLWAERLADLCAQRL